MKSLTSLVLSLSLAAGIGGCKRDYSFLEEDAASAGDMVRRYDLGADHRVSADVDGDSQRKYDLGKSDARARDLGRDVLEADGPRADGTTSDRYIADVQIQEDAARIDAPRSDTYSPDAGTYDAARADRPVIIFPDAGISPDLGADIPADLESDLPSDLGADVNTLCPGEAPLNSVQAGVCAGSRNSCGAAGWQEDYNSIVGYEVNEVSCDGLDNDCNRAIDNDLTPLSRVCTRGIGECLRTGMEYSVACLGSAGWSTEYSGCDAIAGEPTVEECDGVDNNCNRFIDDELIPPARGCITGVGECQRSGLEYLTCLGAAGWSTTYSGCDAVAGEPQAESCDDLDRNCNGRTGRVDLTEIIDEFDRPNQAGLGNNALGNPWINSGDADNWDIQGNAAVTSWAAGGRSNPKVSSDIEHRSTFHTYLAFTLSEVDRIGGGALIYSINSSAGALNGFTVRVCYSNATQHILSGGGLDLATGLQTLTANTNYILKLEYDGSTLGAKIWEEGAPEPAGYLMSAVVADVDVSRSYMTFTGDLDRKESLTTTIDSVVDGCE